jgi:hypothetical protein
MNDLADSHLRRRLFDLIFSFLVFNFVGKPRKTKLECFSWPHFNVLFQSSFDNFFFCYNFVTMATREKTNSLALVQQLAQWCVKTAVLIWMTKTPGERVSER